MVQTVNQLHTKVSLVAAGFGIAVVVAWLQAPQLKQERIVYRPLKDIDWRADLQMVWRAAEKTPLLQEFLSVAREVSTQFAREEDHQIEQHSLAENKYGL